MRSKNATRNTSPEVVEQDVEVIAEVDLEASADGSFGSARSPIAMIASRTNRPLRERYWPLFQRGSTLQYP
jgi:hypothetical protein